MKIKLYLLLTLLFILFNFMTCPVEESDTCHKSIKIQNNSDKNLYISWYWAWHNGNYNKGDLKGSLNTVKKERVAANSENISVISVGESTCLEAPAIGIFVYIFDADEFDSHDWSYISENNMYLKYHLFTYEELAENNWTIIYSE